MAIRFRFSTPASRHAPPRRDHQGHAGKGPATAGEPKVEQPKATGRKETINGFACEEYETTVDGRKVELWLTKDAPDAQKALSQLSALSGKSDPISTFIEKNQLAGFPVRTVVETPMGKVTTTVVTVKPGEIDETQFTVPSDYKEMQAPAMPGLSK